MVFLLFVYMLLKVLTFCKVYLYLSFNYFTFLCVLIKINLVFVPYVEYIKSTKQWWVFDLRLIRVFMYNTNVLINYNNSHLNWKRIYYCVAYYVKHNFKWIECEECSIYCKTNKIVTFLKRSLLLHLPSYMNKLLFYNICERAWIYLTIKNKCYIEWNVL